MNRITSQIAVSLDGFAAGPDQGPDHPLGVGGERIMEWLLVGDGPDPEVVDAMFAGVGAHVMGRRMFGGGDGPWDPSWRGWWGDEPPYHAPVFVLTHHEREPLTMAGGTTFHFVTQGFDVALEQARAAAGTKDVAIAGGASTVQQALRAGVLDELQLHVVGVVLGAGERLLEDVGDPVLKATEVVAAPGVTHLTYRVVR